ncbi:MAG TPA: tetratricopeptide repeat protein [Phycisphaerales bacterium]|nr:tetratricopeptide repeat protein [Phycisphaerales bacterium]
MRRAAVLTGLMLTIAGGLTGCGARPVSMVRADANYHYFRGEFAEAQPLYEEVVDRRAAHAEAHYELGRNLLALGRASEAREQMILAYNLEPHNEAYFEGMADAYLAAGDEEALFNALEHQIRDRGSVEDYLRFGKYAQKLGQADEAERALLGAAEIDGGQTPEPQLALADFYRTVGDRENEIRRLRMALWFNPSDAEIEARLRELGQVPGPTFVLQPVGRE